MRGKVLILASAVGAIALALVADTVPSGEAAARAGSQAAGRAIVEVETPALPAGRGASARERWRELRAESGALLGRVAGSNALPVIDSIPETGQLTVALEGESVGELRRRLSDDPRIGLVRADRPVEFRYVPNDFAFNTPDPNAPFGDFGQWNLLRSGAVGAWDLSRGTGAEVAVIDSGFEADHPDLAGIVGRLNCARASASQVPQCGGTDVSDPDGHGTHVAGLACGSSDNGVGIASLGLGCNLFVAKVFWCSSVAEAIAVAGNRYSDAINLSLGGCDSTMADEIEYAWARGAVPVAAAENAPDAVTSYPARAVQPDGTGPDLDSGRGLVVTAAKYSGARALFAQRTEGVSVAAFGAASDQVGGQQGILSAWPAAATTIENGDPVTGAPPCGCRTSLQGDDRYAYLEGTSMAAPQVAGLVGLIRSVKPNLPAGRVVRLIKLTADNCASYGKGIGWGLIDADHAVGAALDRDVNPPVSRVRRASREQLRIKRFSRECSGELPSSRLRTVSVFASVDGGRYRRIGKTRSRTLAIDAKPGHSYRFHSVAVDRAGNREAMPERPDARLRVKQRR
jgi:subtilisin family serine protease